MSQDVFVRRVAEAGDSDKTADGTSPARGVASRGERLRALRAKTGEMTQCLRRLVSVESPTKDIQATGSCAVVLAEVGAELLGREPEDLKIDGHHHLKWTFGSRSKVLLLGHFDTVWPVGTLERWPFLADGEVATGPGVFDMKAGIVQMFFALRAVEDLDGVSILLTSDEEIGSPTSRALVEQEGRRASAALVLEPSAAGALKVARKGTSSYELHVKGRAAHTGLNPEQGINAAVEAAHQILHISELGDSVAATTVTPTVTAAGLTNNTVPASARVHVDVRAMSVEEQARVDAALRNLAPVLDGSQLELTGGPDRLPLPWEASAELFERAVEIGIELGLAIEGASVGGASDGNLVAAVGTPTLDGLGAVGGNAHAEREFVTVPAMAERAALVAELVERLLNR